MKDLFNPKQTVLKKDNSKSPKITPEENVKLNEEFKNSSLRINFVPKRSVIKANSNDKTDDEKRIMEETNLERKFILEACLVRIMKARKSYQHTPLV